MSCLSSSSSIGSQAREGVARVRFENPPCYGGQSRRCAEVSLLYTGQSRRRAEGVSRTMRVQRLVNRPALSVTPAFLLQDGRQDARCGQDATGGQNARCQQPAKCMRWTRRKARAKRKVRAKRKMAGKTQGAGSQQNAWGGKSAKQREHKTENNRCGKMLGPQSAAREHKKDCPMRQDIV